MLKVWHMEKLDEYFPPINIVVLGEQGVGKTALILRFVNGTFKTSFPSTIIDVLQTQIRVRNKKVNLLLWDTAGQERFRAVVSQYFRKADGVLLVYDVTNVASFSKLPKWLLDLRATNEKASIIIVGNKIDEYNQKNVSVTAVKSFADDENLEFMEASAKTGENVQYVFERLTTKIITMNSISPVDDEPKSHQSADNTIGTKLLSRTTPENEPEVNLNQRNMVNNTPETKKSCC